MNFVLAKLSPREFHAFTGAQGSFEALKAFAPSEAQLLRAWKVVSKASLNNDGLEKLALNTEGGALAPGIYLLRGTAEEISLLDPTAPPSQHIVLISNRHVTLKQGEKHALVWVTDISTGRPVPGASIKLFDKDFNEIAAGETDASGETVRPGADRAA